jgi:branched-chain amino acid transport system substrate-binding protein
VVIEKDDQGKPDVGKSLLAAAYADDKVDLAVGTTGSGVCAGDVAGGRGVQEDPDRRAGRCRLDHRRQVEQVHLPHRPQQFAGRRLSNAVALDKPGNVIAVLANDNAFGRDGVKAMKEFTKKAKIVHEEYLPVGTTDFTAGLQRIIDKLKDQPGKKVHLGGLVRRPTPFGKIADLDLDKRFGIKLATGGNILPAMVAYKQFPGMEGALYYYFGIPKNPANEALVAAALQAVQDTAGLLHRRRLQRRDGGGDGAEEDQWRHQHEQADQHHGRHELRHAQGQDDLPQGRPPGDAEHVPLPHQGDPAFAWGVPELVREIKAEDMNIPIRNKR